jgi:hypothetical protein
LLYLGLADQQDNFSVIGMRQTYCGKQGGEGRFSQTTWKSRNGTRMHQEIL